MSTLRDLMTGVPQSPQHHPEGDVWTHVRMVRRAMPMAVRIFEDARSQEGSPFSKFTPVSKQDEDILKLAAWLHDLGKASATAWTHPDKSRTPWRQVQPGFNEPGGKWQSIGHEEPGHYEPLVQQLGRPWQTMLEKLKPEDKEVLWFVVQQHMSFSQEHGIHKRLANQMVGDDGQFLPDRKFKLLVVFKLMDCMGRGGYGEEHGKQLLNQIMAVAENKRQAKIRQSQRQPPADPAGFRAFLKQKGLPDAQVDQIVAKKFGAV